MVTAFFSRRAARSAASFTTFSRSAPVKPGVRAAIVRSSTLGDRATPRACTRRISSRPLRSGRSTTTCRSKRPGRTRAGSSTSGRFVAAMMMTPLLASNPSISTSSWFRVCSRSSCAPRPGPTGARAALADRVDLVEEHQRRRLLLRLLEQLAHARGAQAHEHLDELRAAHEEERHVRLAGDGAREQRLAAPGGPEQQHALGDASAQPLVLLRVRQELDDLAELLLGLVDARDVGERGLELLAVVDLDLVLAHVQRARGARAHPPEHEPVDGEHDQQEGQEVEDHRQQDAGLLERCRRCRLPRASS